MARKNLRVYLPLFLFLLILTSGILLRLYQIDYNFDGDEIFSVRAASGSFSHMIGVSIKDRPHPPLHNILLFLWIKVWGNSEASARVLSVLASLFFLLVLYRLALLLMPIGSALFVLSICSLSPFFIYFGQQARPYSLTCLFAAISVFLLLKIQKKPSTKNAVLYFSSCTALVYTQYMGMFIVLPQLAAVFFSKIPSKKKILFYGCAGMLSIIFWIALCSINEPIMKGIERVAWIDKPNFFAFVSLYISPFGFSPIEGTTKLLIGLVAIILSSIVIKHCNVDKKNIIFFGILALFGPLVAFFASQYGPVSVWAPRQLIGPIIFFVCLIGIALALFRGWMRILLGLVLIAWCILNVPNAFPENSKPPWRFVASLIAQKYQDQNIVVQERWMGEPLRYYLNKDVHYLNNFKNGFDRAEQFVFVCRPRVCDKLSEIQSKYKILDKETINSKGGEYRTIYIYFFEKVKNDHLQEKSK
jgi:hypothetical protein